MRGGLVVVGVKAAGCLPQVAQDVHDVDDDRDLDLALRLEADPLDLVVGAVHECDPGAAVVGVAPLGFVEDPLDHLGGGLDDAGGQPLVPRDRPRGGLIPLRLSGGEDVSGVRGAGLAS